jgi:hypothetical protein
LFWDDTFYWVGINFEKSNRSLFIYQGGIAMKTITNKLFLLGLIIVLCILAGCTESVPQSEEDVIKQKLQEFVDYLVKLDYSQAQACLVNNGPTYSELDTLYAEVKSIVVSGGYSNCFVRGEIYVNSINISGNVAQISHDPLKIYFNCISYTARKTYHNLNIYAAQKVGDEWLLW